MKVLACMAYQAGKGDPFLSLLPVGVGSLVAMLRAAGVEAKAANFIGLGHDEIRPVLNVERPDLVGISVMTHNRSDSVRLAELAKGLNPACFVVFGGPHATHRYREILATYPAVDAVVLGEGEETLRELAETLTSDRQACLVSIRGLAVRCSSGIILTPPRSPVPVLDDLPPAYAGFEGGINIDLRHQLEFIITSRGCPASCSFCSSPRFWGKSLRFRSPQNMVDEIRSVRDRYGLIYFSIRDDTFTADRARVIEFCRLLLEERLFILWNCQSRVSAVDREMLLWMRRAGCDCIQYGIESGSPVLLKSLGKRATPEQAVKAAELTCRVGIRLSIYLITGMPGETEQELRETLSHLEAVKADDGQVSPLAYYPGTRLFEEAVTSGNVPADIFERSSAEAIYVRNDSFVAAATRRLLKKIESIAATNSPGRREVAAILRVTGYCHASNIAAGEFMTAEGSYGGAERRFKEIVEREPDNPWGWLLLGELWREMNRTAESLSAYRKLAELVPAHIPAWESLAELYAVMENHREAGECRGQAAKLESLAETGMNVTEWNRGERYHVRHQQ